MIIKRIRFRRHDDGRTCDYRLLRHLLIVVGVAVRLTFTAVTTSIRIAGTRGANVAADEKTVFLDENEFLTVRVTRCRFQYALYGRDTITRTRYNEIHYTTATHARGYRQRTVFAKGKTFPRGTCRRY